MTSKKEYYVGQIAAINKTFNLEDVVSFAGLCGDTNPIHLDEKYAANTRFNKRIVHGPLVASLFGTVFGTILPGHGAIYVSQTLRFRKPVYLGDTITASVMLVKIEGERARGFFKTTCRNQNQEVVIEGEAQLLLP